MTSPATPTSATSSPLLLAAKRLPHPSAHAEHAVGRQSLLRRLLQIEKADLWAVLLYSTVIGLIYLAVPVATQAVVNTVAFGTVLQPLAVLTTIVFLALAFSAVLQLVRTWMVELLQQRLFVRMAGVVTSKLLNSDVHILIAHRGPELVNRFLEVATLQKATSVLLIDGLAITTQIVFSAALLALYHPWLLGFDVLLILLIAVCILPFLRKGIRTSITESETKYEIVAWFEELAKLPDLFRSEQSSKYAHRRTRDLLATYLERRRKHFRLLLNHVAGFLTLHAVSSAALLGIGGWLVIQRQLTLGQLIASELVVNLMLNALTKFGKQLETYYDLEAAMDKLSHLTDLPSEQRGNCSLEAGPAGLSITVKNVTVFDADQQCHFGVPDIDIAPGESVCLQGSSGSSKSLLLDCIRGAHPVESGAIELDGCDVRRLHREQLRSQAVLVRDVEIFEGSVLDNLTFGREGIPEHQVRKALLGAGLWETVSRLPDGLTTTLQSGGAPFTHQQALRLMMARALLGSPRLLIVDIPTVSGALRESLLRTLFEGKREFTVLLCTDCEDLQRRCDRLVTLWSSDSRIEVRP